MKTAVITGSARGFGFEMAKVFKRNDVNVVLSDINEENLQKALGVLKGISSKSDVIAVSCNVTKSEELENLYETAKETFGGVDVWINNAGVNQPDKPVCELTEKEIRFLIDIDVAKLPLST